MPTIWNRCNNKCIMCTNPLWFQNEEISSNYSFESIKKELLEIKKNKKTKVLHLTGGEPTIHPDFLKILHFIDNEIEAKICLISNGRMFSYKDFAEKVLEIKDITIETSILGHEESLHDSITGIKGSFAQMVAGVKNILGSLKEGQKLEIRIIMIKNNYKFLNEILDFVYREFKGLSRVIVIFPEPEGRCQKDYKNIGLVYSETKEIVEKNINKWKDKFNDLRLYHFPLCALSSSMWKFIWISQRPDELDYGSNCVSCEFKKYCSGIHKNYLKIIGDKEFLPPKSVKLELNSEKSHHPILNVYKDE